jgi:hypothetical protein
MGKEGSISPNCLNIVVLIQISKKSPRTSNLIKLSYNWNKRNLKICLSDLEEMPFKSMVCICLFPIGVLVCAF